MRITQSTTPLSAPVQNGKGAAEAPATASLPTDRFESAKSSKTTAVISTISAAALGAVVGSFSAAHPGLGGGLGGLVVGFTGGAVVLGGAAAACVSKSDAKAGGNGVAFVAGAGIGALAGGAAGAFAGAMGGSPAVIGLALAGAVGFAGAKWLASELR